MSDDMAGKFDFRSEFADSTFVLAGHGDGCAAWWVHGWSALVDEVALHCVNAVPPLSESDRQIAVSMLSLDEWSWSDETPSKPYHIHMGFEAESLVIYRLTVPIPAIIGPRLTPPEE